MSPDSATLTELHAATHLKDYGLQAVDGDIGTLQAFYFDDLSWAVRYLVVSARRWLAGRRVLISPVAIGEVLEHERLLHIELTREQIRNSPPLTSERPVSRRYEEQYYRYYGWPPYWEPAPLAGSPPGRAPGGSSQAAGGHPEQTRLRSSAEVRGYRVQTREGPLGQLEDFIIDTRYWVMRYVEVDTRDRLPGGHVLVSPGWVACVDWAQRTVAVDLERAAIESAPRYSQGSPIDRDYEARLFRHYRRQAYWQPRAGSN